MYASPDVPSATINGMLQLLAYHFMILYFPIICMIFHWKTMEDFELHRATGFHIQKRRQVCILMYF